MNDDYKPSAPHAHSGNSTSGVMLTVFIALFPGLGWGIWMYGWPALNLLLVTLTTVYLAEFTALKVQGKPLAPHLVDGSALVTACLLVMSLPPWAPWWIGVFGGAFAILIGKHIFGGLGQNVFNPAMLARVALLIAFPLQMTTWVEPAPIHSDRSPDFISSLEISFSGDYRLDSISSASVLGEVKTGFTQSHTIDQSLDEINFSLPNAFMGFTNGSLGESSAVLMLLGGIFLLYRRIISWHIPLSMLATVALLASGFSFLDPDRYLTADVHLLSGGLLFAAFFIATDPVTSPSSRAGQLIFGTGCGFLDFVIRTWGGYPEGIGFAVLLMNAVTPLIDHYIRPRRYGRTLGGKPLEIPDEQE